MPDPRSRNTSHHATAQTGPEVWRWASKEQWAGWKRGPTPLCLSGGFGAGKTILACRKIIRIMDMFPRTRFVIARRVWTQLRETTMKTFFKILPPAAWEPYGRRSDTEKYLRINNGSEILWMHLEDPEDTASVIPGLEINGFFIDQAEEVPESVVDPLMGRLGRWDKAEVPEEIVRREIEVRGKPWQWLGRDGKPIPPSWAIFACNPESELHWIYRRFHPESQEHWEKKIPERNMAGMLTGNFLSYHDLGYKLITMPSTSNRFLTKQNLDALLVQDESFQRRFVRGEWGIPEGQIHQVHPDSLVPGDPDLVEQVIRTSTLHRVLDHGDSAPTACGWFATNQSGDVIFYREYYVPNRLISEHRREIAGLSKFEQYQFQIADPSIFHKVAQKNGGRWSVANEYEEVVGQPRDTAIFWTAADNNELGTRNRINEYLRWDPEHINPFTKQKGSPRLFFITKTTSYANGCYHIIRETRAQRRVKIGSDLGKPIFSDERDENITDHGYDLVRYGLSSRPPIHREVADRMRAGSFAAVRAELMRFKRAGGHAALRSAARKAS